VTLLLAVLSSALMISPAAYHRIVFRHHRRDTLVQYASRILLFGLALLSLSLSGAIVLVTSFLFGSLTAGVAGGGVAIWISFFWYVLPVRTRLKCEREEARYKAFLDHIRPHIPHHHDHHHHGHGDSWPLHAHHKADAGAGAAGGSPESGGDEHLTDLPLVE
jgi:hypothetical protein